MRDSVNRLSGTDRPRVTGATSEVIWWKDRICVSVIYIISIYDNWMLSIYFYELKVCGTNISV